MFYANILWHKVHTVCQKSAVNVQFFQCTPSKFLVKKKKKKRKEDGFCNINGLLVDWQTCTGLCGNKLTNVSKSGQICFWCITAVQ